ncbi:HVO_2072 family ArtA-dependent S-layer glycoprotein [Halobacteriaceae archaeon GCM10025711]
MGYNIRGSDAGATHYVTIDESDFRGDMDAKAFRTVGDTNAVGVNESGGFVYASVTVDDDTGVGYGEIDTGYLDDSSVDVNLYPADMTLSEIVEDYGGYEDQQSLDVTEGELSIESPGKQYVSGAEVDIAGNATAGLDDVAVYARDEGDWELVELGNDNTISVDSDGSWERENVVLSDASDIFSIPGQYRLGVIDARDAENSTGDLKKSMTTSEFSSGTSTQKAITVTDGSLFASFTSVINGQVSTDDGTVDVEGTATGQDNVLVAFVDKRGAVATERVSVDDDSTFEQDDIVLEDKDGNDLSEGSIEAVVLSLGRDDVAGDGELPGQDNNDVNALESYVSGLTDDSLTQAQVLDRIKSETVDDTASDDLIVEDSFRYSDGSLSIETVVPEEYSSEMGVYDIEVGETMVVKGRTNAQPDDNTITVEVTDGPSADSLDLADTDSWGQNGTWSVKIPVSSDVEPGTYTIEADDGDNTDIIQFEIVGEGERGAIGQPETTTKEPTTTTKEPTTTTKEPTTKSTTKSTTTEPTTTDSDGQPGFGVALALVAVLGAALLALRTRIEK